MIRLRLILVVWTGAFRRGLPASFVLECMEIKYNTLWRVESWMCFSSVSVLGNWRLQSKHERLAFKININITVNSQHLYRVNEALLVQLIWPS